MATSMRPLPQTITALRERSGYTLRALADAAGIDPATLLRIEAGTSHGRPGTLKAIARALGVPLPVITTSTTARDAA